MFKFYDQEEAENEFWKSLDGFYRKFNYRGCVSAEQTKQWFDDTKRWAKKSATAQELLRAVEEDTKTIHVVGMKGGFQCFSSTDGRDSKKATIFVDIEGRHEIFAYSAHNMHVDPSKYPWMRFTDQWVALDNRITLLHEIGHGRQWIEYPTWFDKDYRDGADAGGEKTIDRTAKEIREKVLAREKRVQSGKMLMTRASDGKRRSVATEPVPGSSAPKQAHADSPDGEDFAPPEWSVHAEMDNMRRHEWPICVEMELPLRSNYGGIRLDTGISAPASAKTTQIVRIAKEILGKEKAEQLKARGVSSNIRTIAKALCPRCGKMVKASSLNLDCSNLLHG